MSLDNYMLGQLVQLNETLGEIRDELKRGNDVIEREAKAVRALAEREERRSLTYKPYEEDYGAMYD